jgi:hypothetical protein
LVLQARATDVESYLRIFQEVREAERQLYDRKNKPEDELNFTRNETLNLIEGFSHLYNKKNFGRATRELTKDVLLNHLAVLSLDKSMLERFEKTVTAQNTYEHIGIFYRKYKTAIQGRTAELKQYMSTGPEP